MDSCTASAGLQPSEAAGGHCTGGHRRAGAILTKEAWVKLKDQWLPSSSDGAFIESLMAPCWDKGKYAGWIAAPKLGIDNKGGDYEYVKIDRSAA